MKKRNKPTQTRDDYTFEKLVPLFAAVGIFKHDVVAFSVENNIVTTYTSMFKYVIDLNDSWDPFLGDDLPWSLTVTQLEEPASC
jgi:hypothetical protein